MVAGASTIPGLDADRLAEFGEYAAQHPDGVVLGLEARAIWQGHALENLGKIGPWKLAGKTIHKPTRDYSIQFGAWEEMEEAMGVEGAHDRIEPMEAALAGMASCVSTAITLNAAREGFALEALEVTARATVDPRALLGIVPVEEAEGCLETIEIEIAVRGELTDEERGRILQMARRSPVHALVSGSYAITTSVRPL